MDSAYCIPGVVSKLFISTNSFRALRDPLKLVLFFPYWQMRKLRHRVLCKESHRSWVWCWVSESLLPAPELCCLGRDSLPGAGHRNASPLPARLWSRTPGLCFWLSDSALFFSRSYFIRYILHSFLTLCVVHIRKININHECLWHFKKMGPF